MVKTLERPRLKASAQKKVSTEGKLFKGDSQVLKVIKKKITEFKHAGQNLTQWEVFAPLTNIQTSGTVKPFVPYDFQVDLVETIDKNQNIVICKSRQMGISETICSYLLMRALTEPGFSAVVFSKTQADSSELGRRIREMAVSLGSLCPQLSSESATRLSFKGLGKIHFLPVTARAARGIPSVSVVLFDEAAFIDGIDGVYQAAMPTLSMLGDRGKVIFNSTPNGRTGLFYRLLIAGVGEQKRVQQALKAVALRETQPVNNIVPYKRNPNTAFWEHKQWAKVFLHWRSHPVYGSDPDWADKTRSDRKLTVAQWNQEYELDFAEGQRQLFALDLIDRAKRGQWLPATGEPIQIWKKPIPGHRYIAGVDPNLGGDDNFACPIFDVSVRPFELVAEYYQNRRSKDYNISNSLALMRLYRPSAIGVETNNGGIFYLDEFQKLEKGWQWEAVVTTTNSKISNTDRLTLILERDLIIFSENSALAQEAPHFIESVKGKTRSREAEAGFHDDAVMGSAIAFSQLGDLPTDFNWLKSFV